MKIKYVENDYCYVLSNFGSAKNPIFLKKSDVKNFKKRINKHLGKICEFLDYSFTNYEFQIMISMKSREELESFYLEKYKGKSLENGIPESTYILSQEMANLQSGYAKHFNYKYKRKGAVFARRFSKHLIVDELDMMRWKERLDSYINLEEFDWKWKYDYRNMVGIMGIRKIRVNRRDSLENGLEMGKNNAFPDVKSFILQGRFKKPQINLLI